MNELNQEISKKLLVGKELDIIEQIFQNGLKIWISLECRYVFYERICYCLNYRFFKISI